MTKVTRLNTILLQLADGGWMSLEKRVDQAAAQVEALILDLGEQAGADMKTLKKLLKEQ